jgi:ABC-type glycerol-3-phosphate transport system substrate-binding protein
LQVEQKTLEQIKNDFLPQLAAGEGPVVIYTDYDFLAKNSKIFSQKIEKASRKTTKTKTEKKDLKLNWLKPDDYPDAIKNIFQDKPLAYPVTYDTLVLFWNKDILNAVGYTEPPRTYEELIGLIPKLRKFDAAGQITFSPIALGSSRNINASFEYFLVLMAELNQGVTTKSSRLAEALFKTLDYYTQFADSKSENFSWHPNLANSRETFLQEKTAMLIDFYSFKEEIAKRNPRFNFGIAPLLVVGADFQRVNYFKPYFFAVPRASDKIGWLFLKLFDKNYAEFVENTGLASIKISGAKNLEATDRVLFDEMLVGDMFSNVNSDYIKPYIQEDIENWLSHQKDIKQLILIKQVSKFYKK